MAKTFDEIVYSLCKNYTDQSQLGFKSVKQVADGFEIEYVNGTKATYTVQNMHQHTNMAILNVLNKDADGDLTFNGKKITNLTADQEELLMKFSLSADGKLLYDGKPIEGAGGAGDAYDDTVLRGLIDTNKINIATNTSNITNLTTKIGTTYDKLTTAIGAKANTTDLTTHTDDTDIHITTAERTKWNEVVNKANKTEVLLQDKIQTTTGNETHDNVYSAQLTKDELDKKANSDDVPTDDYIKSLADGQITANSVDYVSSHVDKSLIPNMSLIKSTYFGNHIPSNTNRTDDPNETTLAIIRTKHANCPTDTMEYIIFTIITDKKFGSEVSYNDIAEKKQIAIASNNYDDIYVRSHAYNSATWTKWRKVCTTSVADVSRTELDMPTLTEGKFENAFSKNISNYSVKNGVCTLTLTVKCVTPISNLDTVIGSKILPKSANGIVYAFGFDRNMSTSTNPIMIQVDAYGNLLFGGGTTGGDYRLTFSYPVAE